MDSARAGKSIGQMGGRGYIGCMTSTESSLLEVLNEMERGVAAMRGGGPKPDLMGVFARIDALAAQLPRDTDPDLLHVLHRKSYEKARLMLAGRKDEAPRGSCGGHVH